ncbi:MAG: TatD family nuclease-associated radical SAM protein [Defluviitaleaceae bacterium]|nr:TatD family nuclease-associated radical SAM protein [Defluviitaleaceae bacterium]
MTVLYRLGSKLYINLTNACPCSCVFCLRCFGDGPGGVDSLWLEREPSVSEINDAIDGYDLTTVDEIVYCGYGEPMERAEVVVETARHIRSVCPLPVRVNTNGLVKLVNPGFDLARLDVIDTFSISLNADDEDEYLRLARPRFGAGSYAALLSFAREVGKKSKITFTVVGVLDDIRIRNCEGIAALYGAKFRVR